MKRLLPFLPLFFIPFLVHAQAMVDPGVEGRWDIIIQKDGKELPSWLEVMHSGRSTLWGRFVYAFGSARPVAQVKKNNNSYSFSIPVQWEPGTTDMEFSFTLQDDKLTGTMKYTDGKLYNWTGVRAPKLDSDKTPVWGKAIELFNRKNTEGWHASGTVNQWIAENGILKSPKSGSNLITDAKFTDFKLHVEFRYPKGSNSGVYLRGRYEVQIEDSYGEEPLLDRFSSVYGFLVPSKMVIKPAGEWQSYDITLIGRKITLVVNGETVICDQIIPGITGGALDSKEGEPGPIYFQGDHGPVEFRNIVLIPAR
jgi:hypothetical protein